MNILLIAFYCIFTVLINGEINVTYQNLKIPVINTHIFNLTAIRIHKNKITNNLRYEIHSNQNNDNITHAQKTLAFHMANIIEGNEGVLHSNDGLKLTPSMILKFAADDTSTTTTTTVDTTTTTTVAAVDTTTTTTTVAAVDTTTTTTAVAAVDTTTTTTVDTITTTSTTSTTDTTTSSSSSNLTSTATSNTASPPFPTGEPPPTRSAQLGMGLGIVLIGFVIIGEIVYFKCFYQNALPNGDYIA